MPSILIKYENMKQFWISFTAGKGYSNTNNVQFQTACCYCSGKETLYIPSNTGEGIKPQLLKLNGF